MTSKKALKEKITQAVLNQLPDDGKPTFETAMTSWWANLRKEGGLRLSVTGDLAFRKADIEFFDIIVKLGTVQNGQKFMLELNKKIKCPYFIVVKQEGKDSQPYIRLYDSKIAMLVELYGDMVSYLNSIQTRRNKND